MHTVCKLVVSLAMLHFNLAAPAEECELSSVISATMYLVLYKTFVVLKVNVKLPVKVMFDE